MSKLIKSSIGVLVLIVAGKLFSFLRDIIISSEFGSNFKTDAYFAANNIPSLVFTAVISSYLVLLIPTYKRIQIKVNTVEANLFVSRIINVLVILSVALSLLGFYFIEELIYLVAPGFDTKTSDLSKYLGKILILSFPLSSVTLILATISNANNKYFAPHLIPLTSSLVVIVAIYLFSEKYGIVTVAIAGVFAFLIQLIIQIYISRKHFIYSIRAKFFDVEVKKMTWLIFPIFLGFSVDQINLLVNSIISSNLIEGSLSSLNYAQRLQFTINGTLSTALITVIYPLISKLAVDNKIDELTDVLAKSLRIITIILIPIVSFLAINSKDFVSIIYFRGNFDEFALNRTSSVFFYYSFNVLFISVREVILRLYYIKQNTKIPLVTSILSLFVNIVLSLIFVQFYDVSGLALANLFATGISTTVLFKLISKKIDINLNIMQVLGFTKTIILPIIFIFIFVYFNSHFISSHNNVLIFLAMFVITIFFYFSMLIVFKQKDALFLFKYLKNKLLKLI